jgi:hypothetical protein
MKNKIYMPILKGKKGEFDALKMLDSDVQSIVLPLIEVPAIPWDFVNEREDSSLEKQILSTVKSIKGVWNENYEILVDTKNLEEAYDGNRNTINVLSQSLIDEGFQPIPVIPLNASDELLSKLIYQEYICLRITFEDQEFYNLNSEIDRIKYKLNTDLSDIILLLDMNFISADNILMTQMSSRAFINSIDDISSFKDFFFAATSFPINLSGCKSNSVSEIERAEVTIHNYFNQQKSKLSRLPKFSDYGITNPDFEEMDPRLMTIGASIRYTSNNSWFIFKGGSIKKYGSEQYYDLSSQIVSSQIFSGQNFSWGDKQINDKANRVGGPGNSTVWRQIGTNHHIEFVVNQLSN